MNRLIAYVERTLVPVGTNTAWHWFVEERTALGGFAIAEGYARSVIEAMEGAELNANLRGYGLDWHGFVARGVELDESVRTTSAPAATATPTPTRAATVAEQELADEWVERASDGTANVVIPPDARAMDKDGVVYVQAWVLIDRQEGGTTDAG